MMDAIIERCAGLDVHQATVVACVLIGQAGRKPHKEIRTFSTMTRDLEAMRDWLKGGRMSAWRAPGFTGSRSIPSWKATSS
jgi:hypothetical protein